MLLNTNDFGEFLVKQRMLKNVERDTLGEGLYSLNQMGKIERGERYPEKMVRDRLLARLGESGYDYECFLQPEEYEDWEARRDILDSLDDRELDKAEQLMEEYEIKYAGGNPVARQFLLIMRIQWMELKGIAKEERGSFLEEAVKLTVPAVDTKPLHQLILSIQELNLMLEYHSCYYPETMPEYCVQMLQYLEKRGYDPEHSAMLGAKVALFYCNSKSWTVEKTFGTVEQLRQVQTALKICSNGIEKLRDKSKIYFCWELLQKKKQYLKWLLEQESLLSEKETAQYRKELEQTREFYILFGKLYERFQVQKETNGFTCFYREHEIYCLNDVIRARRRMLGISREQMEKELLYERSTLKRLESKGKNVHTTTARAFFQRLNLSAELHRAQIVTDSQEALRLEEEFRWENNQRNYDKAGELLAKLKQCISMDLLINQQYIFYSEIKLAYDKGEITKEEFIFSAKEALELTIPWKAVLKEIKEERLRNGTVWLAEKYLTNIEATILYNIARMHGNDVENEFWEVLKEYFEWLENKCSLTPILGMYGFVMTSVASWMGNRKKYEESTAINEKIVRELLRTRNLSYVHRNLYGLLWNDNKSKGFPMDKENPEWTQGLLECLTVDIFCKDEWLSTKIKKRLKI